MADGKKFYLSKMVWVNALMILASVLQGVTGKVIIDAQSQLYILGVVNLILRLITKEPVIWE